MDLKEHIERIKKIMIKESKDYFISFDNFLDPHGKRIELKTPNKDLIGYFSLALINNSLNLDPDLKKIKNSEEWINKKCEEIFVEKNKTLYLHDMFVLKEFRRCGYANKLLNYGHGIAKDNGFKYITLISKKDNEPANNLYLKNGYNLFIENDSKNFYKYSL